MARLLSKKSHIKQQSGTALSFHDDKIFWDKNTMASELQIVFKEIKTLFYDFIIA